MSTTIDLEEPKQSERVYYRHRETGELAYLVRFGGKLKLRLDRPNELALRSFSDHQWFKDEARFELLPMQRALIALEQDKAVCKLFGLQQLSRRDWTRMRDIERIDWLENGPASVGDHVKDRVRHDLWKSTMEILGRLK